MPSMGTDWLRRRGAVLALALAHGVNDSYGYVLPAALPALIPAHGISLGLAGLLVATYQITSSVLQPFIGHLADRGGLRWLAWAGVALGGVTCSLLGLVPAYLLLLPLLACAGLGSAMFHPASAAAVMELSEPHTRGRWLGIYITFGNFGLGVGPLAVGPLIEWLGLPGTWLLAPPALLVAVLLWRLVPPAPAQPPALRPSLLGIVQAHRRVLLLLFLVVTFRSWATGTFAAFLPLLGNERGLGVADAARVLTLFLVGGALGGLLGAILSDRFGRDRVIVGSMLLSVPFGLALALDSRPDLLFWIATGLCGLFLNGSFATLALRGQESVPGSAGMMSGVMLGLTIGLGGLFAIPMARLAEVIGLGSTTALVALLPLIAAAMVRFLPQPATQLRSRDPAVASSGLSRR